MASACCQAASSSVIEGYRAVERTGNDRKFAKASIAEMYVGGEIVNHGSFQIKYNTLFGRHSDARA